MSSESELDAITAELETVLDLSQRYLPGYADALLRDIHARLKNLPPGMGNRPPGKPPFKPEMPPAIPQEFSSPAPPQPTPPQPAPPPPPPVGQPAPKAKVVSHPAHPKAKGQVKRG